MTEDEVRGAIRNGDPVVVEEVFLLACLYINTMKAFVETYQRQPKHPL